jgi:hypothetical protein
MNIEYTKKYEDFGGDELVVLRPRHEVSINIEESELKMLIDSQTKIPDGVSQILDLIKENLSKED